MRPIVGVHLGRFDFIFNPIVNTDFKGGLGNLEFVPAVRAAWNTGGRLAFALEEYADFGSLNHFKPSDQQSHTLFAVIDYGGGRHGLEFGVGRGLTPASDTWVIKLMLMQDL
jgi:predicted TPR repeat methyltransferase